MDRSFLFDADFSLLDGCKYRISGISKDTTINGITLTKVKSSARLMVSPVDDSAEDLHTGEKTRIAVSLLTFYLHIISVEKTCPFCG